MKILATTAVCAVISAVPAWSATVIATFEGDVKDGFGAFDPLNALDITGETATLTIVGEDDAPVEAAGILPPGFVGTFSSSASYALGGISINVPAAGVAFSSANATIAVFDDLTDGTDTVDLIVAQNANAIADGASLAYVAAFEAGTLVDSKLSSAIELGLSSAPTIFDEMRYDFPDGGFNAFASLTSLNIAEEELVEDGTDIADDQTDDGSTGGPLTGGGIGDDVVAGDDPSNGDGLTLTPVPLPATAFLMLAGLGGLAAARRRKS